MASARRNFEWAEPGIRNILLQMTDGQFKNSKGDTFDNEVYRFLEKTWNKRERGQIYNEEV